MTTTLEIHREHNILESNIKFYSQEINFLLKTLTKEYAIMASKDKIKTLDAFWKEFEKHASGLQRLSNEIKKDEGEIYSMYTNSTEYIVKNTSREEQLMSEFLIIISELKLLKQSLYDYLENIPTTEH